MSDDEVVAVLGSDHAYVQQLATALRSLADSAAESPYRVFVLHPGFEVGLRRQVEESCGGAAIEWVGVPDARLPDLPRSTRLPRSSAYRLLVPELLPPELSRVVYLDADVLVRHFLSDLWAIELDAAVGAVRDAYIPTVSFEVPWRSLSMNPKTSYFNAGVMLMSLDRWRAEEISHRTLTLMRSMRLINSDQTALNAVIDGAWQLLPPEWNAQPHLFAGEHGRAWAFEDVERIERAIADPCIVHFCHGDFGRPWEAGSTHPFRDEWFATLDRTAWAGWRPRRNWTAGAVRRARRAGRALLKHPNQ